MCSIESTRLAGRSSFISRPGGSDGVKGAISSLMPALSTKIDFRKKPLIVTPDVENYEWGHIVSSVES